MPWAAPEAGPRISDAWEVPPRTTWPTRVIAFIGAPAELMDRLARAILPFVPGFFSATLVLAGLLAFQTVQAASETSAVDAARPRPESTSVADLTSRPDAFWVTFEALVSGPHADNSGYISDVVVYYDTAAEPHDREGRRFDDDLPPERILVPGYDGVRRFFYVLRDPDDPSVTIMARSEREAVGLGTRTIAARVLPGASGAIRLAELGSIDDAPPDSPARRPGEVSDQDEVIVLTGRFSDGRLTTCSPTDDDLCSDGEAYSYTVTGDDGLEVSVISPHAPGTAPVRLTGIISWDPSALEVIYSEQDVITALDGAAPPDTWLFEEGVEPPVQEVSFAGAIVLGALATLLLASWLAARGRDRLVRRARASSLKDGVVGAVTSSAGG